MKQLTQEGFSDKSAVLIRSADMRYIRQAYELSVPIKDGTLKQKDISAFANSFHDLHEKAYGYTRKKEAVEFVNLRVVAIGKLPEFRLTERILSIKEDLKPMEYREVFFEGSALKTPVYLRDHLLCGQEIMGPAIIEQMDSTTVVFPKYQAATDRYGNLLIQTSSNS